MPVTKDEVTWAYRMFFGREPESENSVLHHMQSENLLTLRKLFLSSNEFLNTSLLTRMGQPMSAAGLNPLDIDTDASEEQLCACVAKIKEAWEHLGVVKPHYSVLTREEYLPENIEGSIDKFWSTSDPEVDRLVKTLERYGLGRLSTKICVEYGCGVGRVTTGLAKVFDCVHAYDISAGHLAVAGQRAGEIGVDNIEFHLCSETFLGNLKKCDFFYSRLVFQHNPPPLIKELIRIALRSLKSGGIAIFQVPTYRVGYRFNTVEWLAADHALEMQMHCLPQQCIFELIAEENCVLLELNEDNRTGAPDKFVSNDFVIRKRGEESSGARSNGGSVGITNGHPAPLAGILSKVVYSNEFWRKSLAAHAPELVRDLWRGLQGRDPGPEELAPYASALSATLDLASVTKNIINSEIFWENFLASRMPALVQAVFRGLLGREGDSAEVASHLASISRAGELDSVLSDIVGSAEFRERFTSLLAPDLVCAAYLGLLRREPDPEGMARYVELLSQTRDLAPVLVDIVSSEEFRETANSFSAPALMRAAYKGLLGREPDSEELAPYVESLSGTHDLASILADFINSERFRETANSFSAPDLVRAAYRGLLGREPDSKELAPYVESLSGTHDLASILADFINSEEFRGNASSFSVPDLVRAAYKGLLGREPDSEELAPYVESLSGTHDLASILADFINSEEFRGNASSFSATDLVRAAYKGLLGREPDNEELAPYVESLSGTHDLASILADFINSEEFRQNAGHFLVPELVRAAYLGLLEREPDEEGLERYTELLGQGDPKHISGSLTEVLVTLTSSDEFHRLQSKTRRWPDPADTYEDPCVVFIHIERTAGTTMQQHLGTCFGRQRIYREHKDYLYQCSPGELSQYSVFAGHFNYDSLRYIPRKNISVFTFVREPKKRLLSLYYFWRAHEPEHPSYDGGVVRANQLLIENFFEDYDMSRSLWNDMLWSIMGERCWLDWRSRLAKEKNEDVKLEMIENVMRPAIYERLDDFLLVGLQEEFDRSIEVLFRLWGKEPPEKKMVHSLGQLLDSEPHFKRNLEEQPYTPRLDSALDRMVQLDNIIYERSRELFHRRLTEFEGKPAPDEPTRIGAGEDQTF